MPIRDGLKRHIAACNNVSLPGRRQRFHVAGEPVGWLLPEAAAVVGTHVAANDLAGCVQALIASGQCRWRNEDFDVRAHPEGSVLATIDRGALPVLGIEAVGVHLNGLVQGPGGLQMWIGRRALDKRLDPGKLDHIVGGGVPAGLGPAETLVKEAGEEAGIPAALAAQAMHRGVISYAMERPEGLRRDRLHCYDLMLPNNFEPYPVDGEVIDFELWPIRRVLETVRDTDDFKFNVNLVLIDLFARLGLVEAIPDQ